MKTLLRGAVAALAITSMAGTAMAGTHHTTTNLDYAGGLFTLTNPTGLALLGAGVNELGLLGGVGTRYTASTSASDDSVTATPTVNTAFTLTGSVNKDCSFYAGNNSSARNIDFGTIGVRTGDNENVNSAFEMAGDLNAHIQTLTAGCNTNNTVSIAKNDINGLVNSNPGAYDTSQFQANIPYSVEADWRGVGQGAATNGSNQSLMVGTSSNSGSLPQGAWRSQMDIAINAPAITGKGLVAGTYSGTMTVTLSAI